MQAEAFRSVVKEQFPFNLLREEELSYILEDARSTSFSKNEYIFHEDDEEMDIYFLLSGHAKNILHRTNGRQFSVRFYYPGDLVGLMIMLTSGEMTFSVQALDKCKAIRFNKLKFLEIMSGNKEFSRIILESIGNRMKSLYDEIRNKSSVEEEENISLFKTRAAALMESPLFINEHEPFKRAVHKIKEHETNGVMVSSKDGTEVIGVIGKAELMNYVLTDGSIEERSKALDWMNQDPFTVDHDSFAYEALSYFKYHHVDLVPVMKDGIPVGMLTAESFLGIQDSEYLDLTFQVTRAEKVERLINLSPVNNRKFQHFVRAMLAENMPAYDISELISNYNDEIHRQIIKLCEQEMKEEGYGLPPVPYCFIVMGSEGRKEQAFSTDQDNGLILNSYEHLPNSGEINEYFSVFARKINITLERCGFPQCSGGIMAQEEKWRKSIDQWKQSVNDWIANIDAEEIRDFTIFLDFRPIYGDFALAEELRELLTEKVKRSHTLQQLLTKDTLRFRVPRVFGRIGAPKPGKTAKKKTLNLKKAAIMQIVNGLRIYAIKYGIKETNTLKRLKLLVKQEAFHPRDAENTMLALHHLLSFRIGINLDQLEENRPLSNEVAITDLPKDERRKLKTALGVARRMQQVAELSFNRNRVV
ncbi:DUF294 nucleotidyltransferase-like domain-containing protein [Bacillus marinisedimentorum]|uniref:DUF294 nucleotidyltransferase-like domain-containing protein n=1 Tax=Bacillus marinisedimentorum TaxID=1821260 RepID=UPI0007DFB02D|nr:DUF294 nucleotidyltransferase-like domain-containing protein [Bacillus marinisedimentorum]